MTEWLLFAHKIGDDSYLAFTGGQPLRPSTVNYAPKGGSETP
jgi:hypothetical protein